MLYPKIQTLFNRFPKGHEQQFKVDETQIRRPEYAMFDKWLVTEKIDGMNVGVDFNNGEDPEVVIHGRSYKAQFSPDLLGYLKAKFTPENLVGALTYKDKLPTTATIFMEGYGPGIQKGGYYRSDKSFRVFDINIDGVWLNWHTVLDICKKLQVRPVPVYIYDSTDAIVAEVKYGLLSTVARVENGEDRIAEGVVVRTEPLLLDRTGDRVMWKLKTRDFSRQEAL